MKFYKELVYLCSDLSRGSVLDNFENSKKIHKNLFSHGVFSTIPQIRCLLDEFPDAYPLDLCRNTWIEYEKIQIQKHDLVYFIDGNHKYKEKLFFSFEKSIPTFFSEQSLLDYLEQHSQKTVIV